MKSRIRPNLTSKEQQAFEKEVMSQLREMDRKHSLEMDALMLWQLHVQLGFGPKRLRRFYDRFIVALDEMDERYDLESFDKVLKCTEELKAYGIDIEQWDAEREDYRKRTAATRETEKMARIYKKHADRARERKANEGIQKK